MIRAWVFYYNGNTGRLHFEELDGNSFAATEPEEWGLAPECTIMLVLQQGQFIMAWVEGAMVKP